ncbi:MAG: rod shape-determining protein MreC [Bacteroidales bacterium]|nr:rod shape-determining protein MreC [Bacteroidales bacterium]
MQNLLKFLIRIIDIILYLILVFVCIFFIYKTSAYRQWALNGFSKEVCGPLLRLQSNIEQYTSLKQENVDLLAQNEQLMSMIAHQNMDMANNLEDSTMYDFIHARVIENTISKRNNVIILNKGSKAGIQPDMGVISPQGIVGIVKDVSPNFSIVLSLLNENFSVSAKDKRTETVGMITWNGKNYKYAQLENLINIEDVRVGDTVVTQYSMLYPMEYPVGVIAAGTSSKAVGGYFILQVELFQNFSRLDNVYVVKSRFLNEMKALQERSKDE